MRVKILKTGEVIEAKRLHQLTEEELKASVSCFSSWEGNEIFIHNKGNEWDYMFDDEVEIIEE